jgi:two-component system sensor histidine kinase UhpB
MRCSAIDSQWDPVPPHNPQPVPHRSMVDMLAIVGGVALFFVLSVELELAERLNSWTRIYERWQLDEMPLALLVLSLGLVWFGWRRWRELRREIQIRSRMEAAQLHMLAQNRQLAQQLIRLQESERRHIARELHDDIGQCCVAVKVDAALIARESQHQHASIHAGAQRISDSADHLQTVLRGILNRLRPIGLDELGLVSSLQILLDNWQARHGIACSFSASGDLDALDEACTITLYRSVQESLTNIARHAQASQARITIAQAKQAPGADQITLTVHDNGIGLPAGAAHQGMGILGMRERVNALGGQLSLHRLPAGGTQLQVRLPLPCKEAAA